MVGGGGGDCRLDLTLHSDHQNGSSLRRQQCDLF